MKFTKEYNYSAVGQDAQSTELDTIRLDQERKSLATKSKSRTVKVLVAIILLLVATNIYSISLYVRAINGYEFKGPHTGISRVPQPRLNGYNVPVYNSHNLTEADEAWNKVATGHGLVAVDRQWAKEKGLPPTRDWKPDRSKVVYSLAVYHSIHCVPLLRQMLRTALEGETKDFNGWEPSHAWHCLDTIRQELMCTADDTLLSANIDENNKVVPIGHGQVRQCRNWEAIRDWATQHDACYLTVQDHPDATNYWDNCVDGDGIMIPDSKV